MDKDAEHLKLLSIFYYIKAGLNVLVSFLFLIYFIVGVVLASSGRHGPPILFGTLFAIMGVLLFILAWVVAGLSAYAAYCLTKRRHRTYCIVIACSCLSMPFGTILGIFTLIVLQRPTVHTMFEPGITPFAAK